MYVIVALPPPMPYKIPPVASTDATDASLVLHEPPPVRSDSVVLPAWQTASIPEIAAGVAGNGFTVIGNVAVAVPQPDVTV